MLNYQKIHYNEYRILMEDGTEQKVSREECFAHAEEPTADNPFKQRWYYSPDHTVAIRLPRNETGEAIHRVNAADLKTIERDVIRKSSCVGQLNRKLCRISCYNCYFKDCCIAEDRAENGCNCKRKCEICSVYARKFRSLDTPVSEDDCGESITPEYEKSNDFEIAISKKDADYEYIKEVQKLVDSLEGNEKLLYECLKGNMSLGEIANSFGVSVQTIITRKKKLMEKFSAEWLDENCVREEAIKELIASLNTDEKLLYSYIRKKIPLTEIAKTLGVHRKTIEYRRNKLKAKFVAAGLEKYF